MASNSSRIQASIDSDLYAVMEKEFLNFKLSSKYEKRDFVKKTEDMRWDICDNRLYFNWREFIEAAIKKWVNDKKRLNVPLLKKEIILR